MKKNKKGFTLIELLAVIVILAVIAVVTVPVVLNLMRNAREKALVTSGYGIIEAMKYKYMNQFMEQEEIDDIFVEFPNGSTEIKIEGKIPDSGNAKYTKDGKSALAIWDNQLKKCAIKYEDDPVVYISKEVKEKEKCSIENVNEPVKDYEYTWNGYIYYEIYYPVGSTDRKYRISDDENIVDEESEIWYPYEGPIWIKVEDISRIWPSYKINNEEIIIPPQGQFLVDIIPNTTETARELEITIIFDKEATEKRYRIDGGTWINYEEPFVIKENCLIEAQGSKTIDVYDTNGDIAYSTKESGKAAYVISNIDRTLKGPNIFIKDPVNSESVVSVEIEYPENAEERYYRLNSEEYKEYKEPLSITKYGTKIEAYYTYDEDESDVSIKTVISELEIPSIKYKEEVTKTKVGSITITYPEEAYKKYYETDDIYEYTTSFDITKTGTEIKAYYEDKFGNKSETATYTVSELKAPIIKTVTKTENELERLKIEYPSYAETKKYVLNGVEYEYEEEVRITTVNALLEAYYVDALGNESEIAEYTYGTVLERPTITSIATKGNEIDRILVEIPTVTRALYTVEYRYSGEEWQAVEGNEIALTKKKTVYVRYKIGEDVSKNKTYITKYKVEEPVISNIGITGAEVANVKITAKKGLTVYYKIGKSATGYEEGEYNGETFKITENGVRVIAYAKDAHGNKSKTTSYLAKKAMSKPIITRIGALKTEIERVEITYPSEAVKKYYSLDGETYHEYVDVVNINKYGTIVYAYWEDEYKNKSNRATLKISGSIESPVVTIEYVESPDGGPIGKLKVECGKEAKAYYKIPKEEIKPYTSLVNLYKYNQTIQTKCVDVNGNYKNRRY